MRLRGTSSEDVRLTFAELPITVVAFDTDQARFAGDLIVHTKRWGLSLGDRACLALGLQQRCRVITFDRIWSKLDIGIDIELGR